MIIVIFALILIRLIVKFSDKINALKPAFGLNLIDLTLVATGDHQVF